MKQKDLDYFIREYLENAPLFMSFIRPREALLFTLHRELVKQPVLDFGCGDGFFCETVFGKGKVNIGLDLVENPRIQKARDAQVYKKLVLYDGKSIPLPSNSLNTVVSNCVLEHIPQVDYSVSEVCRVLKPGGYFLTSVMTSRWSNFLWGRKLFKDYYVSYMNRAQAHASLFSEAKWSNTFLKNGFEVVEKTGYINEKNAQMLDLFHYLSLPSLISYMLMGKWVLFPGLLNMLHVHSFVKDVISSSSGGAAGNEKYAAQFYVLRKKK